MKIVLLCGSHLRHLYIAEQLYKTGYLAGLVIENRYTMVPSPPAHLEPLDRENFIRHFKDRDEAENKFFGHVDIKSIKESVPYMEVNVEELNSNKVVDFIKGLKPNQLISYGVHKLNDEVLDICPDRAFNIHGGLSPWFKGNITLFWPFYLLRPNWAGMTVHHLSNRMDAGDIIHHSLPVLEYGDGVHDVACKAVLQVGADICQLMKMLDRGEELQRVPQGNSGKLFIGTDWTPQHLRVIYNLFNNNIVDQYLDGKLENIKPSIVKSF